MDNGGTSAETTIILSLLSGLAGSVIGFIGAWFLQSRADARHARSVVNAILMEMVLNAATLKEAVKERSANKGALNSQFWERFAPDLTNCLPPELIKAMYLQHDWFDKVSHGFRKLLEGVDEETGRAISFSLVQWAYSAEKLAQMVSAQRRARLWHWRWWRGRFESQPDGLEAVLTEIREHVRVSLIADGYDVDEESNLRTGPVKTRWFAKQPN